MIRRTNRYPWIFEFIILPFHRFHVDYKIIRKNSNGYKYQNDWITRSSVDAEIIRKKIEMDANIHRESSNLLFSLWIIIYHSSRELEKKKEFKYSWICWNFIILPSNMIIVSVSSNLLFFHRIHTSSIPRWIVCHYNII